LADVPCEIIVVDGGSTDGALEWLLKQKDVITIVQHNRGRWRGKKIERRSWGYFMNLGFRLAQGKYICMLSDDCLVVPGAIRKGLAFFESQLAKGEKVGGVAFYMRNYPDEERYYVHVALDRTISVDHGLYLNKALEDVGYLDEESYVFYFGDIDLALKLWDKGYKILASEASFIEHSTHADILTRKSNYEKSHADFLKFRAKWQRVFPLDQSRDLHTKQEREYVDQSRTARKLSIYYQLLRLNFKYPLSRLKGIVRIRERLGLLKRPEEK
jgi:GT2 family glycosyltransferase